MNSHENGISRIERQNKPMMMMIVIMMFVVSVLIAIEMLHPLTSNFPGINIALISFIFDLVSFCMKYATCLSLVLSIHCLMCPINPLLQQSEMYSDMSCWTLSLTIYTFLSFIL